MSKQVNKSAGKKKTAVAEVEARTATQTASSVNKVKVPAFRELIVQALEKLADRRGSSRQAIIKCVVANNSDLDAKQASKRVTLALRSGLKQGWLSQAKGVGASGSFRLNKPNKTTTKKRAVAKKIADASQKPVAAKKAALAAKEQQKPAKKPATKKQTAQKVVSVSKKATPVATVKKAVAKKVASRKAAATRTPKAKTSVKKATTKSKN
jgi:histone H1/5